jgi:hypothetical protein
MLFMAQACIHVFIFVPPIQKTQGKQVDPQEGRQASREIIPHSLDHFYHDGSIPDEECDNNLPNGSTVTPNLVLGANDSEKHPQCIQHYQEDRSQEDKRDIERQVGKGLVTRMEKQWDVPHRRIL